MTDLALDPLGTLTLTMGTTTRIPDTPSGTRVIVEFPAITWESDRVRAKLFGNVAADWLAVGPEGTATLDMRFTLATDDGATLFVSAYGRTDSATFPKGEPIYLALFVEAGDPRYAWLNRAVLVGRGGLVEGKVPLTVSALR